MDNKLILPYNHIQTAHCENGVATGLLRHHGLEFMTEPLMFGLGSGIFYIHIPFCEHKCIYCDFYSIITKMDFELSLNFI